MKKKTIFQTLTTLVLGTLLLTACGENNAEMGDTDETVAAEKTVVVIADIGGIDDKSFNQSAWEGLQAWGAEHNLEQGTDGYDYLQSNSDSDYVTNFNTAVGNGFDTIIGIGFRMQNALEEVATQRQDTNFAIIDGFIENLDNVASVSFRDNEAAFLAGVAAAQSTKTNKVGFIGGQESESIDLFEAGYLQGVAAVDESIEVDVQYVGTFADPAKAKAQAAAMYNGGVDIIFHAAGNSGNGVFSEAKDLKKQDSDKDIWVIGADRDQTEEGVVGGDNVTLTSTLKEVDAAVQDLANRTLDNDFPGGEHLLFGLTEEGVGLADGQLDQEVIELVSDYKEKIISGELEVIQHPSELE